MSLQTASASTGPSRSMSPTAAAARPITAAGPMPAALSSRTPVSPLALLSFSPSGLMMSG